MGVPPADVESDIAARLDAGDAAGAATLGLRVYGPPILGYVAAIVRDESDAAEVFSIFSEDLWKGIAQFRRESAFKTWAYRLAWHAALRWLRDPYYERGRRFQTGEASKIALEVRSTTALHLQDRAKDALAEMRAALAPDEQSLLILRIDRGLEWAEIAAILREEGEAPSEAALRKRFERLKDKLRQEAICRGLLKV
jgi:RNA polymerase sigma-70 factor (ECF subfamily)